MCVVSAVSDYYTQPNRWPTNPLSSDPEAARLLREAIAILERIDKRLKDVECNDPVKAKFLKALDEYAKAQTPIAGPTYDSTAVGRLIGGSGASSSNIA